MVHIASALGKVDRLWCEAEMPKGALEKEYDNEVGEGVSKGKEGSYRKV